MGIRLMMEAADRGCGDLTWRERGVLLILAMSAMDATRVCPPIERRPDIIKRIDLPRKKRFEVIASLVAKGVLIHVERGRNGVAAVYAIAEPGYVVPDVADDSDAVEGPQDGDASTAPEPVDNTSERPGDEDIATTVKGPRFGDPSTGPVDNPLKRPRDGDPTTRAAEREASLFQGSKGPQNRDASAGDSSLFRFKSLNNPPLPPRPVQPPLMFAVAAANPGEGGIPGEQPGPATAAGLAAEIRKTRPEWSTNSIIAAIEDPDVAERPWPIVIAAMRIVAADRSTKVPSRLARNGEWWAEAARRSAPTARRRGGLHEYDHDPVAQLCRQCNGLELDSARHFRKRSQQCQAI
jgi:hypothetical protein